VDYSILVRSGFTKKQAMQSQFLTAVEAFVTIMISLFVLRRLGSMCAQIHSKALIHINSTIMGIAIYNATSLEGSNASQNLAASV
jgi:zinc transporter 7